MVASRILLPSTAGLALAFLPHARRGCPTSAVVSSKQLSGCSKTRVGHQLASLVCLKGFASPGPASTLIAVLSGLRICKEATNNKEEALMVWERCTCTRSRKDMGYGT